MSQAKPTLAQLGALLCAAETPLSLPQLAHMLECERSQLEPLVEQLRNKFAKLGMELVHIASGLRVQTHPENAELIAQLWKEASPRFTRATLETMALIAYRQPITRGEIEHIRSVSVSSNIIRTLLERGWIRVIGHRDVPGRPALYGTTSAFLDYFNLRSLAQLPPLPEIKSIEDIDKALAALIPPEDAQDQPSASDAPVHPAQQEQTPN